MDPVQFPEDLSALSVEELTELDAQGIADFDRVFALDRTADNLESLRGIKVNLSRVRDEIASRREVEDGYSTIEKPAPFQDEAPADEPEETEEESASEDEEESEEEAPVEEAPAEDEALADDSEEDSDDEDEDEEAVTASSTSLADVNDARGPVDEPESKFAGITVITAAANAPGLTTGAELSMESVTEGITRAISSYPKPDTRGRPSSTSTIRTPVAIFNKPFDDDLKVNKDGSNGLTVTNYAAKEARLPGGSLTAAGGWCAPSETIYDLCTLEAVDGILELPEVSVTRGGIQHTTGPDFRTIYDSSGYFSFTEADDIAGDYQPGASGATEKPCMNVPCPSFTTDRLDVDGLCITSDVLSDVAYPEMTQRFIEGALVAHAHKMNDNYISDLVAGSTAVGAISSTDGAAAPILNAIGLTATDLRYANRMPLSASLEVIFPYWVKELIRADVASEVYGDSLDRKQVTDSMIESWMRERGVNIQFVYDWQDNFVTGVATDFGAATPITAFPTTVQFLLFPAGTWVKGTSDVLTLDTIYDSVNIKTNNFTALFTEEGWMTMKRCHDSRLVTVDTLDVNGRGTP